MRILQGHRWGIRAVAFHPTDPTLLVSAGDDHLVRVWSLATGEMRELAGHRRAVAYLTFAPDGSQLVSGGRDGRLLAWDRTLTQVFDYLTFNQGRIRSLVPSWFGSVVVVPPLGPGQLPDEVVGWRPGPNGFSCRWRFPLEITRATPSSVGEELVLATPERLLLHGHPVLGTPEQGLRRQPDWSTSHLAGPFPQTISALRFSPDASKLVVAWGSVVELHDHQGRQRQPVTVCRGHKGVINALAFSPDGRTLLTGSADRSARLWDVATGQLRAAWRWDLGPIWSVAISADGMLAAAGGEKNTLLVWDLDGV